MELHAHPGSGTGNPLLAAGARLRIDVVGGAPSTLADDVIAGFGQSGRRWLPAAHLYDAEGIRLWRDVLRLDEYYPVRVEAGMVARAAEALAGRMPRPLAVELGAGTPETTRLLLDAWGAGSSAMVYAPADPVRARVEASARALSHEYPALAVRGLAGSYEAALELVPAEARVVVLLLGGTLGGFTPAQELGLWRLLRARLAPGAHVVVGFDRRAHAGKPAARIQQAYDDPGGVTARFHLNLFGRLARELGAVVAPGGFRHLALYRSDLHQIELHLESVREQDVVVGGRRWSFARGERIRTETARKFDPDELVARLADYNLMEVARYGDSGGLTGLLVLRREQ